MKHSFKIITALVCIASIGLLSMTGMMLREKEKQAEETMVEGVLEVHPYDWTNLKDEDGILSYEDDTYTSEFGIDVSDHNGDINWKKVKKSGVKFAFIRVGYRGYISGEIKKDAKFDYNIQNAKANGIKVGVYFFSQAATVDEAREEAEFTLHEIRDYELDLPVVYDAEKAGEGEGRIDHLSREVWTQNAVTFLHIVENYGYQPMIYNSSNLYERLFLIEYLQEFDIWVAHYNTDFPSYTYRFDLWQYSSTGEINGISTDVDMNIMFQKKESNTAD